MFRFLGSYCTWYLFLCWNTACVPLSAYLPIKFTWQQCFIVWLGLVLCFFLAENEMLPLILQAWAWSSRRDGTIAVKFSNSNSRAPRYDVYSKTRACILSLNWIGLCEVAKKHEQWAHYYIFTNMNRFIHCMNRPELVCNEANSSEFML